MPCCSSALCLFDIFLPLFIYGKVFLNEWTYKFNNIKAGGLMPRISIQHFFFEGDFLSNSLMASSFCIPAQITKIFIRVRDDNC